MCNVEYKILKLIRKNALDVPSIKSHFLKSNAFDVENTVDELYIDEFIYELSIKELETYKKENIENQTGGGGKPSEHYLATIRGLRLMEVEKQQRIRFYMPFIFSAIISIVTISISR